MVSKRRARQPEDKAARRESIVRTTLAVWSEVGYAEVTMGSLAEKAGLSKGTLYLYFTTKEELFLEVHERLLSDWFAAVEQGLSLLTPRTPTAVAHLLADTLDASPELVRLTPLLQTVLERNISTERAVAHKTWLLARVAAIAPELEAALPGAVAGAGARILVSVQALVSGLGPMSDPAPIVAAILEQPEFHTLRVQFGPALRHALIALLNGWISTPSEPTS